MIDKIKVWWRMKIFERYCELAKSQLELYFPNDEKELKEQQISYIN